MSRPQLATNCQQPGAETRAETSSGAAPLPHAQRRDLDVAGGFQQAQAPGLPRLVNEVLGGQLLQDLPLWVACAMARIDDGQVLALTRGDAGLAVAKPTRPRSAAVSSPKRSTHLSGRKLRVDMRL